MDKMFYDLSDTEYSKLDPNMPAIEENDENLPANFQFESNLNIDPKGDIVTVLKQSNEDVTKLSPLSISSSEYHNEQDENDEHSPSQSTDFCDAECGEPTTAQRLTIDFTLSKDDTEFSQKKCCDFWNFIYNMPHLKEMMAIPEPDEMETGQDGTSGQSVSHASRSREPRTSAVEFLQRTAHGPVPSAFAAKQTPICRNKDYLTYCHGSCANLEKKMMEKLKFSNEHKNNRDKKHLPAIEVQPTRKSFPTKLCSQMDAWDLQHPRSNDPPHFVPDLTSKSGSASAQYLSEPATSPKELLCSSDMTCVTCPPRALEKVDLVKKEE